MISSTKVRAAWRAPLGAVLTGAGCGLGLGALFMTFGMADHAADHVRAQRMAEAAAVGYAGSYLEAEGQGLRFGLQQYSFRPGSDSETVAARFGHDRGAAQAKRRADLECMTQAVYYEARGESARGQAAVAQVVMNRVKHPAFPKSVCAVVYQGVGRVCQFSFACDGSMTKRREPLAWNRARDVAARALSGALRAEIGSATHFHTTAVSPAWAPQMLRVANVGAHVFYRFSPYRLRVAPVARPLVQHAVLTSGPSGQGPELRLMSAIVTEHAVAETLEGGAAPAVAPSAKPQPNLGPTPKPADSAMLGGPQVAVAGGT